MIIKTQDFVTKLNNNLHQISFDKNKPLVLKGSFNRVTYISDIDYTAYVHFNDGLIKILSRKLKNLKDFIFIYLNAGTDINFKVPWIIYSGKSGPTKRCDFDLNIVLEWYDNFKKRKASEVVSDIDFKKIDKILSNNDLTLGNLIDIEEILGKYGTIRWFLPDIEKGVKYIGEHKYILLDEIIKDDSPVAQYLYMAGKNEYVAIDVGLVDNKVKKPYLTDRYQFYTKNWYKIFKDYKKIISKDYEQEYYNIRKNFEFINSLLAQILVIQTIEKYKLLSSSQTLPILVDLQTNLSKVDIKTDISTDKIELILKKKLNDMSKPYIDYFFDKLTYVGKLETMSTMRLMRISNIPTDKQTLLDRKNNGLICPFFEGETDEYINSLSVKLLISEDEVKKCLEKISKKENISVLDIITKYFKNIPANRLFIQDKQDKLILRGALKDIDYETIGQLGKSIDSNFLIFDIKYKKLLQIYLLV